MFSAMAIYITVLTWANVGSRVSDGARLGEIVDPRRIWGYELTSVAAWLLVMLGIWRAVARFRPPRFSWPMTLAIHTALIVPASLAHVALMVLFREIVWAIAGENYDFGADVVGETLYEFRKDIAIYIQVALIFALWQWLVVRQAERAPPVERAFLVVPDGAVTHRVPVDEIDHVRSAANYVEIGWRGRTLLHRATLASLEAQFAAHGFVRIHRTALVRRGAIRKVETGASGDYALTLESGETLRGSRRYRLET